VQTLSFSNVLTVDFHNDTLFAIERDDGVFVAVKPIVQTLGLDWKAQHRRINDDPILHEGMVMVTIPSIGGAQETTCLRLELVNGWLFTIDESRVKDEATRRRVLSYKRECYAVLFQHFYGRTFDQRKRATALYSEISLDEPVMNKRSLVAEARQTHGIQAARELWFKLGLPTTPSMYADPRQGEFFYTAIRKDPPHDGRDAA
jgi:hypothetical protein